MDWCPHCLVNMSKAANYGVVHVMGYIVQIMFHFVVSSYRTAKKQHNSGLHPTFRTHTLTTSARRGRKQPYVRRSRAWDSYQIRKIAVCTGAWNAGNVFPRRRFQRKPLVSDPDMHHGMCVTHVPWCMSGSLTCGDGENVPGIPGACAPAILRIW